MKFKSIRSKIIIALTVINIVAIACSFFYGLLMEQYLYPSLRINVLYRLIVAILPILVLDLLIIAVVFFSKSKHRLKKIICCVLSVVLIFCVWLNACILSLFAVSNWEANTTDESDFGAIDEVLRRDFYDALGEENINTLFISEQSSVANYSYSYYTSIDAREFNISFDVKFSESDYADVKANFLSLGYKEAYSECFERESGEKIMVSGIFALPEDIRSPFLHWNDFQVAFCDSMQTFYVSVSGYFDA